MITHNGDDIFNFYVNDGTDRYNSTRRLLQYLQDRTDAEFLTANDISKDARIPPHEVIDLLSDAGIFPSGGSSNYSRVDILKVLDK
jgi:hypothetical protein